MSLKINDTNYSDYKKVFEIFWTHHAKYFDPEIVKNHSPIEALNEFERQSKANGKRALREGLRDLISQLKHYPAHLLEGIETDLAKNNLPNTRFLFGAFLNTAAKVIKRKKINNLDEFYTIKELVVDLTSDITEQERDLLDKYLFQFEFGTIKENGS
jgi:hypothetical protein